MSNKYYQIGYVTKDEMFDIAIVEASRDCIAKTWFVEYNSRLLDTICYCKEISIFNCDRGVPFFRAKEDQITRYWNREYAPNAYIRDKMITFLKKNDIYCEFNECGIGWQFECLTNYDEEIMLDKFLESLHDK